MNGRLVVQGVAGYGGEARGVWTLDGKVCINEIRLSYSAHLQFICGRTLAQLLSGARLELDDGRSIELVGLPFPQLSVPSHLFSVPYRLENAVFGMSVKEERA